MSLKTWLKEFYPVSAEVAARKSWIACLNHGILKWSGLRVSALKKHKVSMNWYALVLMDNADSADFAFDGESCALCVRANVNGLGSCHGCPVYKYQKYEACTNDSTCGFGSSIQHRSPKPMLITLRACLRRELVKQIEKNTRKSSGNKEK
jgi:hypothetical protein